MRTQPESIIRSLEEHPSRLNKEDILRVAMEEQLDEFFEGVSMCLDNLYTFGVKQVPIKEEAGGQGLAWVNFKQLAESLYRRELTGHAARDAIQLAMGVATQGQWNDFYRRILIKDLRCGVSEKTVNNVAKKQKHPKYAVPVFECMLAHDGANHEKKIAGKKLLEPKLDGVRVLTFVNMDNIKKVITSSIHNRSIESQLLAYLNGRLARYHNANKEIIDEYLYAKAKIDELENRLISNLHYKITLLNNKYSGKVINVRLILPFVKNENKNSIYLILSKFF